MSPKCQQQDSKFLLESNFWYTVLFGKDIQNYIYKIIYKFKNHIFDLYKLACNFTKP